MQKILLSLIAVLVVYGVVEAKTYEPTWESLATAPVPEWWDNGKFGIFIQLPKHPRIRTFLSPYFLA